MAAGVPFFWKRSSDGSRLLDGREWNEVPEVIPRSADGLGNEQCTYFEEKPC